MTIRISMLFECMECGDFNDPSRHLRLRSQRLLNFRSWILVNSFCVLQDFITNRFAYLKMPLAQLNVNNGLIHLERQAKMRFPRIRQPYNLLKGKSQIFGSYFKGGTRRRSFPSFQIHVDGSDAIMMLRDAISELQWRGSVGDVVARKCR